MCIYILQIVPWLPLGRSNTTLHTLVVIHEKLSVNIFTFGRFVDDKLLTASGEKSVTFFVCFM